MNPEQIRALVRQEIQANSSASRFKVNTTPRHIHNNVDSPFTFQPILTYIGEVNADGTAVLLPNGWTSVGSGTGVYTITHNLNSTYYRIVANPSDPYIGVFCTIGTRGKNTVVVKTFVPSAGSYAATSASFSFILVITNNRSQTLPSYT